MLDAGISSQFPIVYQKRQKPMNVKEIKQRLQRLNENNLHLRVCETSYSLHRVGCFLGSCPGEMCKRTSICGYNLESEIDYLNILCMCLSRNVSIIIQRPRNSLTEKPSQETFPLLVGARFNDDDSQSKGKKDSSQSHIQLQNVLPALSLREVTRCQKTREEET